MKRVLVVLCLAAAVPVQAQETSPLSGVWSFDKSASQVPKEIGFTPAWLSSAGGAEPGAAAPSGGGGERGRRGGSGAAGRGGGSGAFALPQESYEDARRVQLLTAEVRTPPSRLMIVDTPTAVTITNEAGQSRTLHPTGRQESIDLQGVSVPATTTRERDELVVVYHVEPSRDVRYAYSRAPNAPQLVVDVQFLEHGEGDKARLIYDAGAATETTPAAAPTSASAPGGSRPATGQTAEAFDERPGAELRGIKAIGILVEDLGQQAVACGLNRGTLEDALAKRLAAAGFDVRRNSDEDTYVYVNVITNTVANGTCVSRYDAFLYTHATANLSYRERPVLVQVSLIHRGGIGASAPAGHASAVTRGLEGYIDLFATQIHDANK